MKKNKEILYKDIFKCCLAVILFMVSSGYSVFATDVSIWPKEIEFDYDRSSYTYDAITIKSSSSTRIAVPEYQHSVRSNEVAYIKGYSNRKIKVSFDANCTNMHLLINLTVISGTGIGTVCNYFVDNYTKLDDITLTLSGSIPSTVGEREFTWRWEVYAIPIGSSICAATTYSDTDHSYYTLLAAPQSPVAEPWTPVLDLTCDWASGKTTEAQVVEEITKGAYSYFDQHKDYSGWDTHAACSTFNLTGFLNATWGDCRDLSAVVQVFTWMMGGSSTRVIMINDPRGDIEDFDYNAIDPFGDNQGWHTGNWNFHQVGWYNNVYDACMRIKQSDPRVAVNENVYGSYKTDLRDSGAWSPKTPFYYTTVY